MDIFCVRFDAHLKLLCRFFDAGRIRAFGSFHQPFVIFLWKFRVNRQPDRVAVTIAARAD